MIWVGGSGVWEGEEGKCGEGAEGEDLEGVALGGGRVGGFWGGGDAVAGRVGGGVVGVGFGAEGDREDEQAGEFVGGVEEAFVGAG